MRDELKTKNFGEEIRKCAAEWHELDSVSFCFFQTLAAFSVVLDLY